MPPISLLLLGPWRSPGILLGIGLGRHVWPAIFAGDSAAALQAAQLEAALIGERAAGLQRQLLT